MAGTINLSLSQQLDRYGEPLAGGLLYFFAAGTSTPQSAYYDSGLTSPLANPFELDDAGRIPQFFLADGQIKVRLTDRFGVSQLTADNLLVIGPSSGGGGGGGGGTVDPTTIWQTGDLKPRYGSGTHTGWVRANGRSIGSAASPATEYPHAGAQALFQYLWGADPNLAVSGGRGASAAADWSANKAINLPDYRGRTLTGLDGMGNTAAGRLTVASVAAGADVLGASGGSETTTLDMTNIPEHDHDVFLNDTGHQHSGTATGNASGGAPSLGSNPSNIVISNVLSTINGFANFVTALATTGMSVRSAAAGGGTANKTAKSGAATPTSIIRVPPIMLTSIYIKL